MRATDRYAEIFSAWRWELPAEFNIAQSCCTRWAGDRTRFALYWEDEDGARAACTFWDLERDANRLANALAARIEFGGPAIVIDLGTSTNFDLVDADGAYIGGAIAPGMGLSLEALVGRASKLPRIELRRPPSAIGANTVHAMQSGTVLGYIGLVSGLLTALRGELVERSPGGARVTVVATGGYTYQPWLGDVPGIDAVEPDLTLRGIRYAWEAARTRSGATAAEVKNR
jgi:hypothetical protein